jgi:formate hydrogenlyase subunit 4
MRTALILLSYCIGAPLIGGLLSGLDRKLSARLQGRVGPPWGQPFYDVLKLLEKDTLVVRRSQNFYVFFFLLFMIFTGGLFFTGGDILLMIFALTLAAIFFVLGGFKASSPYSFIGSQRELLQMMAYEPMVIIAAVGMYMVTGSFSVGSIVSWQQPLFVQLPAIFGGFVFVLLIKFRKSPFDLSTSHHAHQELVKGITTEFSGRALAMIEVAHWYEHVLLLGMVYLFFASSAVAGIFAALAVFCGLVVIDNITARLKWQSMLFGAWAAALFLGAGNIVILHFLKR